MIDFVESRTLGRYAGIRTLLFFKPDPSLIERNFTDKDLEIVRRNDLTLI